MGKVKDDTAKANKSASKGGSAQRKGRFAPFVANLVKTDVLKPNQGRHARLWTAVGLGVLVLAGLYRVYVVLLADQYSPLVRLSIPAVVAVGLAWLVFRIVQFPPFVDFLIATEAEMNKVSWTSREDLKRATAVVLLTVFLMAFYLFGVDLVWSWLLRFLRVLQFQSGDFGSQAG